MSFSDRRDDSLRACAPIFGIRPTAWAAEYWVGIHPKYGGTPTKWVNHLHITIQKTTRPVGKTSAGDAAREAGLASQTPFDY